TFTGNRTPVPLHVVVNEGTTSPPGRPVYARPFPRCLGKVCCKYDPKRVRGVFLAGVRPDSPSRSDTFLLLRCGRTPRAWR
ncbi:unnamed protein product, partial [Pylaiella littoralis]